jgi:hypothetical protein
MTDNSEGGSYILTSHILKNVAFRLGLWETQSIDSIQKKSFD